MPSITDKIKSLGSVAGAEYRKPDPQLLAKYQMLLLGNSTAQDYLKVKRGLTDETIKHFQLGYDSQQHAIAIPVFKRGELINIKYRILKPDEGQPKYKGERGAETWLYNEDGINEGLKKKGVLVVEGEFDAMSAWQAGFKNVVSPASGKDSYGIWLEMLDVIPKVYLCYDNDKPGRDAALKFSGRVGADKCYEVIYPTGVKDANDYFKTHTPEDYRELLKAARPFYKHTFKSVVDIIEDARNDKGAKLTFELLPDVRIGNDWIIVISGKTNVGKTSYVLNLATELATKEIPCLILPFERGMQVVGTRYFQVKYSMNEGEIETMDEQTWGAIRNECLNTPIYFAMPSKAETVDVIKRSKRIFDTRVVIIDHLDLMVRSNGRGNYERDLAQTIQELKVVAQECEVVMLIVHHVRKMDSPGAKKAKKPGIEDLKGSAALFQDPECVVMLMADTPEIISVNVVKNKGKMSSKRFSVNNETGKMSEYIIPSGLDDETEKARLASIDLFDKAP